MGSVGRSWCRLEAEGQLWKANKLENGGKGPFLGTAVRELVGATSLRTVCAWWGYPRYPVQGPQLGLSLRNGSKVGARPHLTKLNATLDTP